ncbi:MAG: cell division protein FtsA, partial [Sulfurospirillum sp.]
NIVLTGYASSIAVLNEDEKELGVAVVDMGGAPTDIVVHLGNSIRYNDFIGVGSANVTNDLSMALHTPITAAERVKIEHGSLRLNSNETIELPAIGDEGSSHEVSLEIVTNVIYARIEETLLLIAKSIKESGFKDQLAAGIVLTGGLTKLDGIRELASAIFNNTPVRLARPSEKEIEGMFDSLKEPEFSTAIGLILYGFGNFTPYEMDSNRKLRYKEESLEPSPIQNILDDEKEEGEIGETLGSSSTTHEKEDTFTILIDDEPTLKESFRKFWNRITQLF